MASNFLSVVGGAFGAAANRALDTAQKFANRPSRQQRAQTRAAKAPIARRITQATQVRNQRMAEVLSQPSTPTAVPVIASEVGHLSGQLAKTAEDMSDYGFLPTGNFWDNLKNGSIFINGNYFSANTLLAAFAMLKASRLVHEPKKQAGLLESIAPDVEPIKVLYGARAVTQTSTAIGEDDVFATFQGPDGNLISAQAKDVTSWPVGATVFLGTVPHIAPDWRTFLKTAAAMFIVSREHPAVKIASLFTERLGSFVGLGQGVDFNR